MTQNGFRRCNTDSEKSKPNRKSINKRFKIDNRKTISVIANTFIIVPSFAIKWL
jgi:hypothetical protein